MTTLARTALMRSLAKRLPRAAPDELRVIERVLGRLEVGRARYGELDLSKPRDWRRERCEERLDALVYDVCEELALEDQAAGKASRDELVELRAWQANDQSTVASEVPSLIASTDGEPYEAIEVQFDDVVVGGEA